MNKYLIITLWLLVSCLTNVWGQCTNDVTAPIANCQNFIVYLDNSGIGAVAAIDIDSNSTDNCGIVSYLINGFPQATFNCANVGMNTVVLTVIDSTGNADSCTANVTVLDTLAPIALCQTSTHYLNASGTVTVTPANINGGSFDNCGNVSTLINGGSQAIFTSNDLGTNPVTLTVIDVSGNTSTCMSTVQILDTLGPTAICQSSTQYLDATGIATVAATAIDNGSFATTGISSYLINVLPQQVFSCANIGINSEVLTVTDNAGNTASCIAIVTVVDTIAPIALCQGVSTHYLNATGTVTIPATSIDNGSTDNCGVISALINGGPQVTFTSNDIGANSVTLTVIDASGNTSTCVSTVQILDTLAPTALCQNGTYALDATGLVTVTAAAINNGSFATTGISSYLINGLPQQVFSCANLGINNVVLTVTDNAGNVASCSANVTVTDVTPPTVLCPSQPIVTYLNAAGTATVTAADIDNGSTDNCGIVSRFVNSSTQVTFNSSNIGNNVVTLLVADVSGNTSSCSAIVTVLDTLSNIVSVQEVDPQAIDLKLFPNPAKEQLTISTKSAAVEQVQLYTVTGQLVLEHKGKGSHQVELPVQQLPQGLYVVTITTNKGRLSQKISIE